MGTIAKTLADNLRRIRASRGFTQEALADRMGVSVVTIQNYEAQRRWPAPDAVSDLARALSLHSEAELFQDPRAEPAAEPTPEQALEIVSRAIKGRASPSDPLVELVGRLDQDQRRVLERQLRAKLARRLDDADEGTGT